MGKVLIGAHTSASGGAPNALIQGKEIGATTIQFFTSNQKQWKGRRIEEDEVQAWKKMLSETGISHVMSHDSYLINLGSPNLELLVKSKQAFRAEIERCHLLDVTYMNFHPGAATTGTVEQCLETIIQSLLEMEELVLKGNTKLLLETTAGQGTSVGHRFEQIGTIVKGVQGRIPIGVCIDTCHIFAAGYDIRTEEAWKNTIEEFDAHIGLDYLSAFHLNDSLKDLGSKVDRHAAIGKGKIGDDCFRYLMQNFDQPKYLETPVGPSGWKEEIELLWNYCEEKDKRAAPGQAPR